MASTNQGGSIRVVRSIIGNCLNRCQVSTTSSMHLFHQGEKSGVSRKCNGDAKAYSPMIYSSFSTPLQSLPSPGSTTHIVSQGTKCINQVYRGTSPFQPIKARNQLVNHGPHCRLELQYGLLGEERVEGPSTYAMQFVRLGREAGYGGTEASVGPFVLHGAALASVDVDFVIIAAYYQSRS